MSPGQSKNDVCMGPSDPQSPASAIGGDRLNPGSQMRKLRHRELKVIYPLSEYALVFWVHMNVIPHSGAEEFPQQLLNHKTELLVRLRQKEQSSQSVMFSQRAKHQDGLKQMGRHTGIEIF